MPSLFDEIPSQPLPEIAKEPARVLTVTQVEQQPVEEKPCACKSHGNREERLEMLHRRLSLVLALLLLILAFAAVVKLYKKTTA